MPLMISLTVPSPPTAMMASKSSRVTPRTMSLACPGRWVNRASIVSPSTARSGGRMRRYSAASWLVEFGLQMSKTCTPFESNHAGTGADFPLERAPYYCVHHD